jgi:nucleotide-binding universal stress UspA family protein
VVPLAAQVTDGGPAALDKAERRARELYSYREEMAERLRHLDLPAVSHPAERVLLEGAAADAILRQAAASCPALIVMGTHGRTPELTRLLGSVAAEVSRLASCPVLTVKLPAGMHAGRPHPAEASGGVPSGAAACRPNA